MKKIYKIVSLPFEGHHYGLEDQSGNQYLPIELPASLKHQGLQVECDLRVMNDVNSFINWGTPVKIISFNISH